MRRLRRAIGEALEGLRIAVGNIVANRLRSSLTTLGIVIGVATVIAIVAVIQGLNQSFEAQVGNLGANTLYVSKWPFMASGEDWWRTRNRKAVGKTELEAIDREATSASAVAPMAFRRTNFQRGTEEISNVIVIGTNHAYLETGGGSVSAGRFLAPTDVEFSRSSVVLGAEVAEQLFKGFQPDEVVGRKVAVGNQPFTVVGVLARRGRMLGMDLDTRALVPYSTFLRDMGSKRSINIAVAAAPDKLSQVEDELVSILRRVRRVPAGKPDDFSINKQDQLIKFYQGLTGALYGVAVGVGLITLVVGGIGIMNIMLVSVTERTREIGVRRAIGARRRTILLQFLVESSLVSAVGGAAGTAVGLGAAQLVALLTPLAAAATFSAVVLGLVFSVAVGLLFGIWPAWRAANLDPVEALRYE